MNRIIAFVDHRFQFQVSALFESSFNLTYCDTFSDFLSSFVQAPCPAIGLMISEIDLDFVRRYTTELFSGAYLKEFIIVDLSFDTDRCSELMKLGAFDVISMSDFDRSLRRLCQSAFHLLDAFLKLRTMCERAFLHDIDVDRWDRFFREYIWNCRLEYRLVTLDDILLNFPVYVIYRPESLSRMEKRSTEFQFTKKLLGLDALHVMLVEPSFEVLEQVRSILPDYFELLHAKGGEDALGVIEDFPMIDVGLVSSHVADIDYEEFSQMLRYFNPDIQLLGVECDLECRSEALMNAYDDILDLHLIGPEWTSKLFYLAQLHYVVRSLPRLGNYVLDSDRKSKLKMLMTFCEEKWMSGQTVAYGDLYLFFPELKAFGVNADTLIPQMTAGLLEAKLMELLS